MDKGIFAGCSYTWGQGLWCYMETTERVPTFEEWIANDSYLPSGSIEFKDKIRFARLVSDEMGVEPIVRKDNGGTDEQAIELIEESFEKYNPSNIKFIVFQTTQLYRSTFPFEVNGETYHLRSTPNFRNLTRVDKVEYHEDRRYEYSADDVGIDYFYEWLIENKLDIEDFEEIHKTKTFDKIESALKKYNKLGVPVYILSWTNEYVDKIKNSDFLKDKFITFNYNGKHYEYIEHMQRENNELFLKGDPNILHGTGHDDHPSKPCHEVIANAILKKIKNE